MTAIWTDDDHREQGRFATRLLCGMITGNLSPQRYRRASPGGRR